MDIPKRVEIEARVVLAYEGDAMLVNLTATRAATDHLDLWANSTERGASLLVADAHAAREYAQQFQAIRDALVEFAESLERNARSAKVAT